MSATSSTLVVIEDDPQIRRFLRSGLSAEPFRIFEAETGRAGLVEAATRRPDVVIVDLGLPDIDGVEVVAELREWYTRPIIILSARSNEQEKIKALDAGADDYLTKPFGIGELLARIRAALRRAARDAGVAAEDAIEFGEVRVDLAARRVQRGAAMCTLPPTSIACSRHWFAMRGRCAPIASCSQTCGARHTSSTDTTCASTWRSCGTNWRSIQPIRASCAPRPASAIVCWLISKRKCARTACAAADALRVRAPAA